MRGAVLWAIASIFAPLSFATIGGGQGIVTEIHRQAVTVQGWIPEQMFVTDFARALPIPSELEFMAVSSYGSATSSSGVVRILKDLDRDISGRRVVIVEDIIDSGLTLSWLQKNLATRGPASIEIVALLRKPEAVKVEVEVAYVGFDIPTDFVVGYGLDFNERYRDLPFVFVGSSAASAA